MSTTTPFPFAAYYDLAAHDQVLNVTVAQLIEWYESALGDADKAADGYDAGSYQGAADAHFDALVLLTGVDPAVVKRYHDGQDVTPVSPANRPVVVHIPNEHYMAAHDQMSMPDRDRTGYTLMPESRWYIYEGPRLVKLTTWNPDGTVLETEQVEHAQIMRVLQDHLDDLAGGLQDQDHVVDDPYYDMGEAALSLVLSDAQTGTSLYAWPVMNRLVDRVLTAAMFPLGEGNRITTVWEEF